MIGRADRLHRHTRENFLILVGQTGGAKLSWEAIGAIAEMLGAIGVIGSLGYLASQIRSSNQLARSNARIAAAAQLGSLLDNFIAHPQSSDVWIRGRRDLAELSKEERGQFDNLALKGFGCFSTQHFQFRLGAIEQDEWSESYRAMIWWLGGKGMRDWWNDFGRSISADVFREFVDSEIQKLTDGRLPDAAA